MENNISHINSQSEFEKVVARVSKLIDNGEKLSDEEIAYAKKAMQLIADYESKNNLLLIPRSEQLAKENDPAKIAEVLGFEPDLIELVEFKMYQLKWNQNKLAEELKMPASKVSQILNNKREPDVAFLKGIHEKLGIDGNYILNVI